MAEVGGMGIEGVGGLKGHHQVHGPNWIATTTWVRKGGTGRNPGQPGLCLGSVRQGEDICCRSVLAVALVGCGLGV